MERKEMLEPWPGSWAKWAANYCARNQWRVNHQLGSYEDCMAFCALCYVQVARKYGESVNTPQQFMYLYKLWVTAEFDTLSVKDSKSRDFYQSLPQAEPSIESDAELAVKLAGASSELKTVMNIFLNAPQEVMQLLRDEANSYNPKQFFKAVLKMCKINTAKTNELTKELQKLLTR